MSPDVLIPRPETEEMVEWLIKNEELKIKKVLDLCTGSGCIAIALKRAFPEAGVTAVDVSEKALALARKNATDNGVSVDFVLGDVLGLHTPQAARRAASSPNLGEQQKYDLIVSNPPYVRESERAAMQANVLDYEPGLALFVPDDDPLRFYKAIAAIAKKSLKKEGLLVVEINEALADETCAVFAAVGLKSMVYKDFRGKSRWVTARFE